MAQSLIGRQLRGRSSTRFRGRSRIFGREMPIPRMTAWFGDGAYSYSGILHLPAPFSAIIERLRERAEALSGASFNAALANLYRPGHARIKDGALAHHGRRSPRPPNFSKTIARMLDLQIVGMDQGARRSPMAAAISAACVSSAKCPGSKKRTTAPGMSRLNASAPRGRKNGSFLPHTARNGGLWVRKEAWKVGETLML